MSNSNSAFIRSAAARNSAAFPGGFRFPTILTDCSTAPSYLVALTRESLRFTANQTLLERLHHPEFLIAIVRQAFFSAPRFGPHSFLLPCSCLVDFRLGRFLWR